MVLFAGIAAGAALAVWPMPLEGRKGNEADARQARKKILLLEKGLSPAAQLFAEREINAYLGLLMRNARAPLMQVAWATVLQAVEVAIHPNAVIISTASVWGPVTAGSLKLGPWSVTSRITVVPERGPRGVRWTIRNGRIGHLPLPGPLNAPVMATLRPLLSMSLRERTLLLNLKQLELEEGQISVTLKKEPRRAPDQGLSQ